MLSLFYYSGRRPSARGGATPATAAHHGKILYVVAAEPSSATTTTLAELQKQQTAGKLRMSWSSVATSLPAGANRRSRPMVSTASTPDGFLLWDPGYRRNEYIYDSDPASLKAYHCKPSCRLLADVHVKLHVNVIGGSSKEWSIEPSARHH